jgi:hypothetical protein
MLLVIVDEVTGFSIWYQCRHKRYIQDSGWNTNLCCVIFHSGKARFVRLGDLDLKSAADDAEVQQLSVVRRIPHPDYREPQKYHDIALLQLDDDVSFDRFVSPACLHAQHTISHESLVASGWGRTEPGEKLESLPAIVPCYGRHNSVPQSCLLQLILECNITIDIRFEVFTAVTMKNAVFWDTETQFVLHRRHITSPPHSPAS